MSRIRCKDTEPELLVRRLLHKAGFRYTLHRANLPGKPDLVFPSRKKVVFIHGCFWHMHHGCPMARVPKTRVDFWTGKLNANSLRDQANVEKLTRDGWAVLVLWECELRDPELLAKVSKFLNNKSAQGNC